MWFLLQVNQKRRGRTELHVVSLQGDVDMMKTLLEFKADVECPVSARRACSGLMEF